MSRERREFFFLMLTKMYRKMRKRKIMIEASDINTPR